MLRQILEFFPYLLMANYRVICCVKFWSFFHTFWWLTPSSIYSWFLKPLSILHSQFPTKKSWVVAYFFNVFQLFQKKIYMYKIYLCNFLMRTQNFFFKDLEKKFWPSKHEKTTSKSCLLQQKFRHFRNFPFPAQQPKW